MKKTMRFSVLAMGLLSLGIANGEPLNLSLPQSVFEGVGSITGTVSIASLPANDVVVDLATDNSFEVAGGVVIIPAGTNAVSFTLQVIDDRLIDGIQVATITATAQDYAEDRASVFIQDNEERALFLDLPEGAFEGQGTLTNAGSVSLEGLAVTDLHVLLRSLDRTEVTVPMSVTISAGQSNALFNVELVDDSDVDGQQFVDITAQVPGFTAGTNFIAVGDNERPVFVVCGLDGDMPGNAPLMTTIQVVNSNGEIDSTYSGAVRLKAALGADSLAVEPAGDIYLSGGEWRGAVTILGVGEGVELSLDDGNHHSVGASFNLYALNIVQMKPDYVFPYIYLLHTSTSFAKESKLLWYNTDSNVVELSQSAGFDASDLAVHYIDNKIYVSAFGEAEVGVFDRLTKQRIDDLALSASLYRIGAGPSGVIVSENEKTTYDSASIILWDSETESSLQVTPLYSVGRGTGESDTMGRHYYHADSVRGGSLRKYDISNGLIELAGRIEIVKTSHRELIISGDGSRLFWDGSAYDSDLNLVSSFDQQVYAASVHGELAITQTEALNGETGESIFTLPFSSSVMSFSGDQSKLLIFDPETYGLTAIALSNIVENPLPTMIPNPEVGSAQVVGLSEMSWSGVPLGVAYDVYFGIDSNIVASADTKSAVYHGRVTETEMALPEGLLEGGQTYYWRVDPVWLDGTTSQGERWFFHTPEINITPQVIHVPAVVASYTQTVSVAIESARVGGQPVSWTASSSDSWLLLDQTNGMAPCQFDIQIDISSFAEGEYTTHIEFSDGRRSFYIPVHVEVERMRISKMETDWLLPRIYMLHSPYDPYDLSADLLIAYNTDTDRIENVVAVGDAGDFSVHYADNRIYVGNGEYAGVYDRVTMQKQGVFHLDKRIHRLFPSLPNRITTVSAIDGNGYSSYYLELFDAENGANIFSQSITRSHTATTVDGRFFYNNDISSDKVRKYEVTSSAISLVKTITAGYSEGIVVSMDGSRVCSYSIIYDADLNRLNYVNDQVRAISAFGDLVVTEANAFNGLTGDKVYTLPFSTTVMAFSGDQSKLVLFNYRDGALTTLKTSDIMPLPDASMKASPPDSSVVAVSLPNLEWTLSPGAISYDIYLGSDSNAVANADVGGIEYLGRQSERTYQITEDMLAGNTTYYWRVDTLGFEGAVVESGIWSFQTAGIVVEPDELVVGGLAAAYTQTVSVAVSGAVSWSASCTNDWVLIGATDTTNPGVLDVSFDMTDLRPGTYTAEIEFSAGNLSLLLPVTLSVESMRVVKMVTDWTMPYIYMVHTSATAPNTSRLIWYNTDTDSIERVLDAGENATDMTVHYGDDRIYVNNYQRDETRVFDRASKVELEPLFLEGTMFENSSIVGLNAGGPGRLFVDHGIPLNANVQIWNTENGTQLESLRMGDGDAEISLGGQFYYRCYDDMNYPRSEKILSKFDVTKDSHEEIVRVPITSNGSDEVLVSMDGRRVYNRGIIYDKDLQEVLNIGAEVYAASAYGDLVVTATRAYDGITGNEIYTLPHSSTAMAFSGDQSRLVLFDSPSSSLTVLDTSSIMSLPKPVMAPRPVDGGGVGMNLPELTWTVSPGVKSYDVYLGIESNAVASAGTNSVAYLGRTTTTSIPIPEGRLAPGQTYYWRVDVVTLDEVVSATFNWSFQTAAMAVEPYALDVLGVESAYTQMVTVAFNSVISEPVDWTASCASDWVILAATNGTTSGDLDVGLDLSGFAPGTYTAQILINDGNTSFPLPVTLSVEKMRIVKMEADRAMPYIYLLHTSDYFPYASRLIWFNSDTGHIENVQVAGRNARDLTVHSGDNRIYVNNYQHEETRVFDRSSQQELAPLLLGNDVYNLNAGRDGRLFVEGGESSTRLSIRSTTNANEVAYLDSVNVGDGACSLDGTFYYHCENRYRATLKKFDVTADAITEQVSQQTKETYGSRNIFLSMDGDRVYNCGAVYDSDLNELLHIGSEIYAASAHGDLVLTATAAYNGRSGSIVHELPFRSSVMAISGDQSSVLLFNPADGGLTNLSVLDIMPLPEPMPASNLTGGSVVGADLPELRWSDASPAFAYEIYLGTDSNSVANADTNSSEYLGRRTLDSFELLDGMLTGRTTYFWRIDAVGFGNVVITGDIWNFHTAAISVDPSALVLGGLVVDYTQRVSVAVDSTISDPVAWTASCTNDWVLLGSASGMAPGAMDIGFDMSKLAVGTHTTEIILNDGVAELVVPVTLSVEDMRIVKMATDWTLPYIYLMHTSSTAPNRSLLVWYNTDTDSVEQVLDAGENATDLTVHYADDRIYVSNWKRVETRVFDRMAKSELEPLLLSSDDVYRISAGRAGHVYTSKEYQIGGLYAFNTTNGTQLAVGGINRPGDFECSPDGNLLYYCESYSSYSKIYKFDISQDALTYEKAVDGGGTGPVILSVDGTKVFANQKIYDADLNELLYIDSHIYAASAYGNLIITETGGYNGVSGEEIYTLPFSSKVMAFSGDQSELLLFNSTSGSLTSLATSAIMPLPEPNMIPVPGVGSVQGFDLSELAWSGTPVAIAYDVYFGTDSNAVASATTNSVLYLERQTTTDFHLQEGMLAGNETYYWRVDTVGFGNVIVAGDVWNFQTASIAIDPRELVVPGMVASYTQTVSVAVNSFAGAPSEWTASCASDWVLLGATKGKAPEILDIGFDMSGLAAGSYTAEVAFNDGSKTLVVPVSLEVEAMRIVTMETDWELPYINMIHTSSTEPNKSRLIWYNTDTDSIEKVMDAGESATDLTVHYGDNRIYLNNSQVVDRTTKRLRDPVAFSASARSISAGKLGQVIIESGSYFNLHDTTTGASLASERETAGVGDCSLDGTTYYRSEYGNDGTELQKYSISNNVITEIKGQRTEYRYGSNRVFVSRDGSYVYNCGHVFNSNLNALLNIGSEIYAASAYGDLVLTETKAYSGVNGEEIYSLPFSSTVMAFSGDQSLLVVFNSIDGTLTTINTVDIMTLPQPAIQPEATAEYIAWQSQYLAGADPVAMAQADGDRDGMSNLDEYIAGTDPTKAASCFMVHNVELLADGSIVIYWDAVTNRVYSVYLSPSLTEPFQLLKNDIHYPQNTYTDRVQRVESSGFYRIGVDKVEE